MPAPQPSSTGEGENAKDVYDINVLLFILRDFFFLLSEQELRIRPLRLKVAEKKHGGE